MPEFHEVDLAQLGARLNGQVPDGYRQYVQERSAAALVEQGFDPKTILVLNLQLQGLEPYTASLRRFFINGDGCGNYHFVDLDRDPRKVLLWAHDPPGIEDPGCSLKTFLRTSEQDCRIDRPIQPGTLWICRTPTYGESILDPIPLANWRDAVQTTDGLEYLGYREGKNPFTGELLRMETPGRTRVVGLQGCFISFFHGRAGVDDNPLSRAAAKSLAQKLGARVLG